MHAASQRPIKRLPRAVNDRPTLPRVTRQQPSAPAPARASQPDDAYAAGPCPIASLPAELVALVAEAVTPADLFAMAHTCRAWHGLLKNTQVLRCVAQQRVLGPPPLYEVPDGSKACHPIASGDLAEDVRLEGALIGRLRRGALTLGPRVSYQTYRFSATYRYVLKKDRHAQALTLHRLGGNGLEREPLRTWPSQMLVSFAPVGDAVMVRHPERGPFERIELTGESMRVHTLLQAKHVAVGPPLFTEQGDTFFFATSDQKVRLASKQGDRWHVAVQDNLLSKSMFMQALSQDAQTAVLYEPTSNQLAVHHRQETHGWQRLGAVDSVCCGEINLSARGGFLALNGCGDSEFYRIEPSAPTESERLVALEDNFHLVSTDEAYFARYRGRDIDIFRRQDGARISTVSVRPESVLPEAAAWLAPYLSWDARKQSLDVKSDEAVRLGGGAGTVTLRLMGEPPLAPVPPAEVTPC